MVLPRFHFAWVQNDVRKERGAVSKELRANTDPNDPTLLKPLLSSPFFFV